MRQIIVRLNFSYRITNVDRRTRCHATNLHQNKILQMLKSGTDTLHGNVFICKRRTRLGIENRKIEL